MVRNKITQEQIESLFGILKKRFEQNMDRHPNLQWNDIQQRLDANRDNLWSLNEMEET